MNIRRLVTLVFLCLFGTLGCVSRPDVRPLAEHFVDDMAVFENLISKSASYDQLVTQQEMTQSASYYLTHYWQIDLPITAVLPPRSVERMSNHEVMIHGVARAKNGEAIGYWVLVDENRPSK